MIPPYYRVARIPADQPLVVQPSVGRQWLMAGPLTIGTFALIGLTAAPWVAGSVGTGPVEVVAVTGCFAVFGVLLAWLQVALQHRAGPVLAAGPAGLWIRLRPMRAPGIWLPWEAVAEVYRRAWWPERYLCVRTYDPRVGQDLGGLGGLDASVNKSVFGTGLLVSLSTADRPEDEIAAALAHFAAGRVPLR